MSVEQIATEGTEVERLYSVTALSRMGLQQGRGLVNWKLKQEAFAAVDQKAVLDAMLEQDDRDGAISWLVDAPDRAANKAKQRGTDVHAAAEAIALGATPILVPGIEPYVEQLVNWYETWTPKFLMAEAPVYNLTHRYAGTLDGICEIDGRTFLFDYKTTDKPPSAPSRPPYDEVALQLVAYSGAEQVGLLAQRRTTGAGQRYYLYDPTIQYEPMPKVDGALCVVVSPFDCFAVPVSIKPWVWDTWLHLIEVAKWNDRLWRDAFGAALVARPMT